jgi:hypothetical protein
LENPDWQEAAAALGLAFQGLAQTPRKQQR